MVKAFNSIKEILLVFYQVLFVEAKERYEVTEFYLEKCGHNKKSKESNKKMTAGQISVLVHRNLLKSQRSLRKTLTTLSPKERQCKKENS